jgi:hypothetical protein
VRDAIPTDICEVLDPPTTLALTRPVLWLLGFHTQLAIDAVDRTFAHPEIALPLKKNFTRPSNERVAWMVFDSR